MKSKRAVVLLSGGLDSTTTLAIAKNERYVPFALTFSYGQRHYLEVENARRIADAFAAERHLVIPIDLRVFGGSALTSELPVPRDRVGNEPGEIPTTYVPARNTIFLSYALAWAEVIEADHIFIGVNSVDYSGYPDCRPEYIAAYQTMARLATRAGVEGTSPVTIHAPLIDRSKAEIIRMGIDLDVDYSLTFSCYDPTEGGLACGRCDACLLRLAGFRQAGTVDPIPYQTSAKT